MELIDDETMADTCTADITKIGQGISISVNIGGDSMAVSMLSSNKESAMGEIIATINSLDDSCMELFQIDTRADKLHKSISNIYNISIGTINGESEYCYEENVTMAGTSGVDEVGETSKTGKTGETGETSEEAPYYFLYNKLVYLINDYKCGDRNECVQFDKLPERTCGAVIKYLIIMLYGDLVSDFAGNVNDDLRQIFHEYFLIYIRNGWDIYSLCNIVNTVYISYKLLSIQSLCNYFANKYNLNQNLPYIDLLQIIKFNDVIMYFDSLYIVNLNKAYEGGGSSGGGIYTIPTLPLTNNFYRGTPTLMQVGKDIKIDVIIAAGAKYRYYMRALNISYIKLTLESIAQLIDGLDGFNALGDIEIGININYLINDLQYLIATCYRNYSRDLVLKYTESLKEKRAALLEAIMHKFDFGYLNSTFYADKPIIVAGIYDKQYKIHNTVKLYLSLVYENCSINLKLNDALWLLFTSDMTKFVDYTRLLREYTKVLINADYSGSDNSDSDSSCKLGWAKYHIIISILYDIYTARFAGKISDKNGQVNVYKFYANIGAPVIGVKDIDTEVYQKSMNFRKSYYSTMCYSDYKRIHSQLSILKDRVTLSTDNADSNAIIQAISTLNPTLLQTELQTYSAHIFDTNLLNINNSATIASVVHNRILNNYARTVCDILSYISIITIGPDILYVLEQDYFVAVRQNVNNQPDLQQLLAESIKGLIQLNPALYNIANGALGGHLNMLLFDKTMVGHKRQILVNKICTKLIFTPIIGISISHQLQYYGSITISIGDLYYALFNAVNNVTESEVPRQLDHIVEYIILLVNNGWYSVNSSKIMQYVVAGDDQVGCDSSVVSSIVELIVFKYKYNIIDLFDKFSRESPNMSRLVFKWKMETFITATRVVADLGQFDRLIQVLGKYKMVAIGEQNQSVLRNILPKAIALEPEQKIIFITLYCLWGGGEYLENVYNFLHFIISRCSRYADVDNIIGGPRLCKYLSRLAADDKDGLNTDITRLLYVGLDKRDIGIVTYLMNNMLTRTIIYTHIGYVIRDISYWAKSRQSIELFICILESLGLLSTDCIYIFMVNNIINYEIVGISIEEIEILIGAHLLVGGKVVKLNGDHFGYICPHCCLFVENKHNYSAGLEAPYGVYKCSELNIYLPHFIRRTTKVNNIKNKIYVTHNVYIDSVRIAIDNVVLRRDADNVGGIMNIIFDMCRNYILFLKMYMRHIIEYREPAIAYIDEITKYARIVTAGNKYCIKLLNLGAVNGGASNKITHICITCSKARSLSELVISNELGGIACKSCKTNLFMNSVYFNCVDSEFK